MARSRPLESIFAFIILAGVPACSAPENRALELVNGIVGASGISVTDDAVFWAEATQIRKIPKEGGATESVVEEATGMGGFLIEGSHVVWAARLSAPAVVRTAPLSAPGSAIQLAEDFPGIDAVAADAEKVYWARSGDGTIKQVSRSGGDVRTLSASAGWPFSMQARMGQLYGVDARDGRVWRIDTSSAEMIVLASGQSSPISIAVDEDGIFWLNRGDPFSKRDAALMMLPLDGGTPKKLADLEDPPVSLVLHEESVFWITHGSQKRGTIWKISKSGGKAIDVATDQDAPIALAVDAAFVYWANAGDQHTPGDTRPGAILKAAK